MLIYKRGGLYFNIQSIMDKIKKINKKRKWQNIWPSSTGIWTPDFWTKPSHTRFEFWKRLDQYSWRFFKNLDFKQYQCEKCEKSFGIKSSLEKHFKIVHIGLKPYNCTECNDQFKTKLEVQQHTKRCHDKTKPFECSKCQKNFDTRWHLCSQVLLWL